MTLFHIPAVQVEVKVPHPLYFIEGLARETRCTHDALEYDYLTLLTKCKEVAHTLEVYINMCMQHHAIQ